MPAPCRKLSLEPLEPRTTPTAVTLDPTFGTGGGSGPRPPRPRAPDGQRDDAFDANTAAIAGFGPEASGSSDATAVAVGPDGSIVVAGTGYKEGRLTVDLDTLGPANPGLVGVLRLHPDGTPDATF